MNLYGDVLNTIFCRKLTVLTEAKIQLSNRLGAFRNKKSSDSLMPLKKKKEEENKSDRQRGKERVIECYVSRPAC